jgi:hypothetical protein
MKTAVMATEESERNEHVLKMLSRFGDKAGQHGALARVKVPIMLRVGREANLRLERLAMRLNVRKATLLGQLAETASEIEPQDWYRALVAMQAVAGRKFSTKRMLRPQDEADWPTR